MNPCRQIDSVLCSHCLGACRRRRRVGWRAGQGCQHTVCRSRRRHSARDRLTASHWTLSEVVHSKDRDGHLLEGTSGCLLNRQQRTSSGVFRLRQPYRATGGVKVSAVASVGSPMSVTCATGLPERRGRRAVLREGVARLSTPISRSPAPYRRQSDLLMKAGRSHLPRSRAARRRSGRHRNAEDAKE